MSSLVETVRPETSRALKISRGFALVALGGLAVVVVIILLATFLPSQTASFAMTKDEAFARVQADFPLIADDRLSAPITADGKTFYSINYNNGEPGEALRIYVSGDQVTQLQLRLDDPISASTAHGDAVIPLLKAVEPTLGATQLAAASRSVEGLVRNGSRGSVSIGNERIVVAAGGMNVVITVMPQAAPDPLAKPA